MCWEILTVYLDYFKYPSIQYFRHFSLRDDGGSSLSSLATQTSHFPTTGAFSSQLRDIMFPGCRRSAAGSPPSGMCLKHLYCCYIWMEAKFTGLSKAKCSMFPWLDRFSFPLMFI